MPTLARGGRRSGTPGKAYGNRTDLNAQRTMPIAKYPSDRYGEQVKQVEAQRAVPVASQPQPVPPTPTGGPPAGPPPIVPLNAPTARPNEPLTAGIDSGPGVGAPPQPVIDNPERIRQWLPALERLASAPDTSPQTRNFIRFLRSAV